MNRLPPRVAFFTDCFHEVNGVALTSRQLESFARKRRYPFFSAHAGPETYVNTQASITTVELRRGPVGFGLDADMSFDLVFLRYRNLVRQALINFSPDLVHITGPGDCGILGAILADELGVPLVASWHTNLHEFAARRIERVLDPLPNSLRRDIAASTETAALECTLRFYRRARLLFAPNDELVSLLRWRTGRPVFLMRRGVDAGLFTPRFRERGDSAIVLGYVGRLSPEKNVRFLADLEGALIKAGETNFRFSIIGQGTEASWLREHLVNAEFPGVLRGEALARAYAAMDVFVFPSRTDTFGNVIQEALASGVPAVVTNAGGPKTLVRHGGTGFIANNDRSFIESVRALMSDRRLRRYMSAAARDYARSASWDAVFDELYDAYAWALRSDTIPPIKEMAAYRPSVTGCLSALHSTVKSSG